jgi:predicted nucleotidyltransferase
VNAPGRSLTSVRVRRADPALIKKAVHEYARLLRGSHPEIKGMRWFGSWVNGGAGAGSDVDLCIIVEHGEKRRRDRIVDYLPLRFPVGIDLFVYTEAELMALRVEHSSFAAAIDAGVEV